MKTSLIFLFVIILCGAITFISTTDLRSQTSRGMKISVRTSAGEHIELYNASYALVIGNGNYTNGWDPLPGAIQDVKEVAQALKTHDFNVTLKTDLTADEFEDAFLTFVLEHGADETNRLLFYYAGHGYTLPLANEQERGYLVMVDAPEPDTDKLGFVRESVNMETLVGESKAILARHVLFLFDCCFSSTILNARDRISPESISDNIRYPVRQFITAGRANEPVPDRSVFKTAFLDLIDGRAAEPFRDGYITGAELGLYLKNQVPIYNEAQHPQYGKIRDPKLDKGDFVFVLPQRHTSLPQAELPTLATLSVTSTPSGATVYLDGTAVGKTPLRAHEIDTGIRRVKQIDIGLELAGYKSRVKNVTLIGGENVPWDVPLEPVLAPMIIGQDGAEMVLIPAGEFQMGSDAEDNEKPVHTVYVNAFYIDTYEVTNAQFKAFVDANPPWQKDNIPSKYHDGDYLLLWTGNSYPSGSGNEPVVSVSWYAAMAYAQWAGKRLPTEAEWEKAARGGLDGKTYPWGNSAPDGTQCNFADVTLANYIDEITWTDDNVNDGHALTAPVDSYPANGYGLHNMAGNAYEWCLDEWDAAFYRRSPHRNPVAGDGLERTSRSPQTDTLRVLRGGSWANGAQALRVARRIGIPPTNTSLGISGFRCARDVTPTKLLEKQAPPKANAMPDTSEMVLIPAGEFQMGSNAEDHEKPVHTVYVDAFYIDKYEVTNAQFKTFVDANPQWQKGNIPDKYHDGGYLKLWNGNNYPRGMGSDPVVGVSWYAAMAYAQWVGKRLPTEAEWEKAARGGLVGKKYPWGNVAPNGTQCNFADKNLSERWIEDWTEIFGRNWSDENADDGYSITAPIGSYPPNGYGLYDMAGNAAEWCIDGYDAGFYRRSPRRNPIAGEMTLREVMTNYQNVKTLRVMRGGSWLFNARFLRVANRTWFSPTHSFMKLVGFRCARDVTPTKLLEKQAPPKTNAMPDTSEMVLISAGEFQMGSNDSNAEDHEKPVHTVYVDAFYIDKYEVTNAQFKTFVDANPQWQKGNIPDKYHDGGYLKLWNGNNYPRGMGSDPVVGVSWYAAMAYAQWVGKRLPTEAEWEKAARGGLVGKKYTWGNVAPNGTQCNFADKTLSELNPNEWSDENVNDGYSIMAPIGSYPPNGYGLYDMAGNVWEWCIDEYDAGFYRRSPRRNPVAGGWVGDGFAKVQNHNARMFRGGAWNSPGSSLRVSFRNGGMPTTSKTVIGFRCASNVTP